MVLAPDRVFQADDYDFITGDPFDNSIAVQRCQHLLRLNNMSDNSLRLALRNPENNNWTSWKGFYDGWNHNVLFMAYDIHRSLLPNEVVVESDYPCFEDNYDANRIIGSILEDKGFSPMYYYSGSKSIHCHVLFDFKSLLQLDKEVQDVIMGDFTKNAFIKQFMEFLRRKMVSCWGLRIRTFDDQIKADSHLIRSELSLNKKGFKTFLGYSVKDFTWVPMICNVDNKVYPKIGELKLSSPPKEVVSDLVREFLSCRSGFKRRSKVADRSASLLRWTDPKGADDKELRPIVKMLLKDEFISLGDGVNRAMFILINEFKRLHGPEIAYNEVSRWNLRLKVPFPDFEIRYRVNRHEVYTLKDSYVQDLLRSIGLYTTTQ